MLQVFDSTEGDKCSLKSRQFQEVVHLVDVFLKATGKYKVSGLLTFTNIRNPFKANFPIN